MRDPAELSPDERLREVASILGAGILRLRARAALPADIPPAENPTESRQDCLEVPPETVLSGPHGLPGSET